MEHETHGVRTSLFSILCIVIRMGVVMWALSTLGSLVGFFGSGQSGNFSSGERALVMAFLALGLLISFLLWLYPGPLARLASGRSAQQVFESPIGAAQIQWVALSVLGMYWVMSGILALAHIGYQFFWLSEFLGTGEEAARQLHGQVAYHALEIVLGLSVALGARGLSNLLQKIRYSGSSGMAARKPSASEAGD